MSKGRQVPPRTRAVAVLDLVLAVPAAVRRLAGLPRRLVTGRQGNRLMMRVLVIAAVAVVAGTALIAASLLRTTDGFAPLEIGPRPAPEAVDTPAPDSAGIGRNSSTAMAAPPPGTAPGTEPPTGPSPTGAPAPARPLPLTAEYATQDPSLLGYGGSVAITNPGPTTVGDWTLVITLPRPTLSVTDVVGAEATQDGSTWTFVPAATGGEIPTGGSILITFRVFGATLGGGTPTACSVDGQTCTGLPAPTPSP